MLKQRHILALLLLLNTTPLFSLQITGPAQLSCNWGPHINIPNNPAYVYKLCTLIPNIPQPQGQYNFQCNIVYFSQPICNTVQPSLSSSLPQYLPNNLGTTDFRLFFYTCTSDANCNTLLFNSPNCKSFTYTVNFTNTWRSAGVVTTIFNIESERAGIQPPKINCTYQVNA